MAGENCSSGCETQDHATWGECVRAKRVKNQWLGGTQDSARKQRLFEKQTGQYVDLVRAGGSMATAERKGMDAAWAEAERSAS